MHRLRAVVTAGGTEEPIDDVRSVTNGSTGRFGAAIARALHHRGVAVTVLASSRMVASVPVPRGVRVIPYGSHVDLARAMDTLLEDPPDQWWMSAAVADYTPAPAAGKIRSDLDTLTLTLTRTPKLLATLRDRAPNTTLIGFKLLSGVTPTELVDTARRQLVSNRLDAVVANDLAELRGGRHPVWLVRPDGETRVEGPRADVAERLVEHLLPPSAPAPGPWTAVDGPQVGRARRWLDVDGAADAPDVDDVATALVRRSAPPTQPVALRVHGRLRVGLGEEDLRLASARWADAVARLRSRGLRGEVLPAWHGGTLVAAGVLRDGAWHLEETGLDGHDVPTPGLWTWSLPMHHAHGTVTLPRSAAAAWARVGYRPTSDDGTTVTLRAPWADDDAREAAVALLVSPSTRQVLLGHRRVPPVGQLAPPGGRIEAGESALDAARRELTEETGLHAPTHAPWRQDEAWAAGADGPWRLTTFVWVVHDTPDPSATDELTAAWWSLDDVLLRDDLAPGARHVLSRLVDVLERLS